MLHRRDLMLRLGQWGAGALTLPAWLQAEHAKASGTAGPGTAPATGKAKRAILIYLWGGPPQHDLWDPKPLAPSGIRGEFSPIDTTVPGLQIGEHLPLLSRQAHRFALVRSLTHDSNNHEPSVYYTLTGRKNPRLVVPANQRSRSDFPSAAGVVSRFSPQGALPAAVTLPRPIGHDGVTYAGTHAGFLGPSFDPLEAAAAGEVSGMPAHSLALPAEISSPRLVARRGLLGALETAQRRWEQEPAARAVDVFRDQAHRLLADPAAKSAFRVEDEPPRLRDRYGRNEWGESILLARRLVESGVRLVTVVWLYIAPDGNVVNVWDNHGGTGSLGGISGYAMLKQPYCLPSLDQALSALLEDLDERGLLDETLVAAYGEFGRTPKINSAAGRDHWGACQSVLLAGGGIGGGQVYGSSDPQGAYPRSNPVAPEDLLATIYQGLGIPLDFPLLDPQNRPHLVCEGTPIHSLFS